MTRVFFKDDSGKTLLWNGTDVPYGGVTISQAWVAEQDNAWALPFSARLVDGVSVIVFEDGALLLEKKISQFRTEMFFPVGPLAEWKVDTCHGDSAYPVSFAKYHSGLDVNYFKGGNSDLGKPFTAAADGIVVFVSDNAGGAWGGLVVVWHPQFGIFSRYGHHDPKSAKVKVGDYVRGGETVLAKIGRGYNNSYLAHLHVDFIQAMPPLSRTKRRWWAFWPNNDLNEFNRVYVNPVPLYAKYNCKTPPVPKRCKSGVATTL